MLDKVKYLIVGESKPTLREDGKSEYRLYLIGCCDAYGAKEEMLLHGSNEFAEAANVFLVEVEQFFPLKLTPVESTIDVKSTD